MKTNYEIRYAAHPEDAKSYDTKRIRRDFLIEKVFSPDEVNMVYSMYDRMVVGGAMPVGEVLPLEAIEPLKAPYFLTRREMGIFNVGGPGVVRAGNAVFEMDYKEALYLGSGDREVTFESKGNMKILGLAIGNGCTALAGSILAQQAESATVSIGTGMVVQALASVIIGASVFGRIRRLKPTSAVLLGTILYKAVLLIAMLWLPAVFLKLTMAALFVAALLTDRIGKKKGGVVHG